MIAWIDQVFWSVAVISTVLLMIMVVMDLFLIETEEEESSAATPRTSLWSGILNAKLLLTFIAFLGWGSVLTHLLSERIWFILLGGLCFGFVMTFFARMLYPGLRGSFWYRGFQLRVPLESTGQVLQSVPPHRNGFGKVQLNMREGRRELDAITAGQALPAGAPVRVVDIIDDRVILVEPLEEKNYPHE